DRTAMQWDVARRQPLIDLALPHPEWIEAIDLSRDDQWAVTACDDGGIRVWNVATAELLGEARFDFEVDAFDTGSERIGAQKRHASASSVAFSQDGRQVVITSSNGKWVWLWDWDSARASGRMTLIPRAGEVEFVRLVASAQEQGLLWATS